MPRLAPVTTATLPDRAPMGTPCYIGMQRQSAVHIDDDTTADLAGDDLLRSCGDLAETDDLADALESRGVEVPCEAIPGGLTQLARRHDAVDAEERHAAQNEGRDARGKVHALSESARGDESAIARLRAGVRESVTADRVHDCRPLFLLQGLAGLGKLVAIHDLTRTQRLEVVGLARLAGRCDDVETGASQQGDGDAPHAPGCTGHEHVSAIRREPLLHQRFDAQ